jgi:hypothetical protein
MGRNLRGEKWLTWKDIYTNSHADARSIGRPASTSRPIALIRGERAIKLTPSFTEACTEFHREKQGMALRAARFCFPRAKRTNFLLSVKLCAGLGETLYQLGGLLAL